MRLPVDLGKRVGIDHAARLKLLGPRGTRSLLGDSALDDQVSDVDAFRREFARQRLGKAADAELRDRVGGEPVKVGVGNDTWNSTAQ